MKKIKKLLCVIMAVCILLNVNIDVLASARSELYFNLGNNDTSSTNFLTQEEIHDLLEVEPVDVFNPVILVPYLTLTLTYTDIFGNHTTKIANVSNQNKVAQDVVIVRNVYYTTSNGQHKEKAVQREVGTLRPGQSAKEVFGGLGAYYHINKIAYFAYTNKPTLSKTDTIWIYY